MSDQCRICSRVLKTQHWPRPLIGWPEPLLPGDIPARSEVCDRCAERDGPFPDTPYTPEWVGKR
jgi:hypothetical protein